MTTQLWFVEKIQELGELLKRLADNRRRALSSTLDDSRNADAAAYERPRDNKRQPKSRTRT